MPSCGCCLAATDLWGERTCTRALDSVLALSFTIVLSSLNSTCHPPHALRAYSHLHYPGAIMHPPTYGSVAPLAAGVTLWACLSTGESNRMSCARKGWRGVAIGPAIHMLGLACFRLPKQNHIMLRACQYNVCIFVCFSPPR